MNTHATGLDRKVEGVFTIGARTIGSERAYLRTVKVARKTIETEDIAVYELADPTGADLPPFSAGAHIDVEVAPGLVRQYSLCNNPTERSRYVIGVLKDPATRGGSAALHEVAESHNLRISEPRNHFELEHSAARTLLFAGGIGVTPILSMAEHLAAIGADFVMHYGARSVSRMAFRERILSSPFADKVHLHFDDGDAAQNTCSSPHRTCTTCVTVRPGHIDYEPLISWVRVS